MARALIVGGDDRGRELGGALMTAGWAVRATGADGDTDASQATGLEIAAADPSDLGSLIDAIEGVAVIVWLLGDARAGDALDPNAELIGRLFEEIVDTPVRGVAYEAWGAGAGVRAHALRAERTWHIRTAAIEREPGPDWLDAALAAVSAALG